MTLLQVIFQKITLNTKHGVVYVYETRRGSCHFVFLPQLEKIYIFLKLSNLTVCYQQ